MTMTVLDRALVAGDAGGVTGERQERPDPEVPEKPHRRRFTAEDFQSVPFKLFVCHPLEAAHGKFCSRIAGRDYLEKGCYHSG